MKSKVLFTAITLQMLTACATVVSGTSQSVYVDTPDVEGARCELADSKDGHWHLPSSPGSITVTKGNGPLNITCKKQGYKTAHVSIDEEVAGATFGNIILGGGIGVFVDAASGAAQKYPDKTAVWIEPVNWTSSEAKADWTERKRAYEEAVAKAKAEKAASQSPAGGNVRH